MNKKNFIIKVQLFFIILSLGCTKKVITNEIEGLIKPKSSNTKILQIAIFANNTKDSELDILEGFIPRFIKEELIDVDKIYLPNKYSLSNEKEVLRAKKYFSIFNTIKLLDTMKDLKSSSDILSESETLRKAKKRLANKFILESKGLLADEKNKHKNIASYIRFYELNKLRFKPYIGIDAEKPLDKVLNIYKLKVSDSTLALKTRRVFELNQVYLDISRSSANIILLGDIKKVNEKIKIEIKLFDKKSLTFIDLTSYSFSKVNLITKLDKHLAKFGKQIAKKLSNLPKGVVIVETKPKGAHIFLDGKNFGTSNRKLTIDYGFHKIEILKKGYTKITGEIFVPKNKTRLISIDLDKIKGAGSIIVKSSPAGADVFVDLDYIGKTPLVIKKILPGYYKIRLEKKNYKNAYHITLVKPDKSVSIEYELVKGNNKYRDVAELSKKYKITKNVFFYTGIISITSMVYAFLQEEKYKGRLSASNITQSQKNEYAKKYSHFSKVRKATIGTTVGLVALTILFQALELYTEDIEVGFIPNISDEKGEKAKNVGGKIKIKYKF